MLCLFGMLTVSTISSVASIAKSAIARAIAKAMSTVAEAAIAKTTVAEAGQTTLFGLLSLFSADRCDGKGDYDLKEKNKFL